MADYPTPQVCTIPHGEHVCGVRGPCNGFPRAIVSEGPEHYKGPHEPFDVIDAWQETWPPHVRYHLGCVLKYLARLGRKTQDIETMRLDLDKATQYLKEARKRL